jgi:integrase
VQELNAERRVNRKTPITPSQRERDRQRANNPADHIGAFYDRDSYRQAIEHAIRKGNKVLPVGEKIPHWFPYLLRNSAATDIELKHGLDEAQAQLGHRKADMTRRYSKAQLRIREKLAREQENPFADGLIDTENEV